MKKFIHNASTGENTTEDLTPEEIEEFELRNLEFQESESELLAKQQVKSSALSKLAALGLTEEEAKAILGL